MDIIFYKQQITSYGNVSNYRITERNSNLFYRILNKDFTAATGCLSETMTFEGVMGKRHGADSYISDMKKMKFKCKVHLVFENKSDVCVLYDNDMGSKAAIFTCGWYPCKSWQN